MTTMAITIRHRALVLIVIWASMTTPSTAQEPGGGPLSRLLGRFRAHHAATVPNTAVMPTAQAEPTAGAAADCVCESGADPYGFAAILNQLRARAGLHPLSYDPELSSWASQNNAVQCHRGIGHHVNPCGVQNCGWNYGDANSVAQGWMNSPGHRANILRTDYSEIGVAVAYDSFGTPYYVQVFGRPMA